MPLMFKVLERKMKKWRVINNNMIQTFSGQVFLWDDAQGVAIKVNTPGRPWKKISADFSHWMPAEDFEEIPRTVPSTATKLHAANFEEGETSLPVDDGRYAFKSSEDKSEILDIADDREFSLIF